MENNVQNVFKELDSFDFHEAENDITCLNPCNEVKVNFNERVNENVNCISANMVASGNITLSNNFIIDGRHNGNVEASDYNVEVNGLVIGDINSKKIELKNAKVQGNLTTKTSFAALENTVIVGDVIADDVVIDCKIKGKVTARNSASFKRSSLVIGEVSIGSGSGTNKTVNQNSNFDEFDF